MTTQNPVSNCVAVTVQHMQDMATVKIKFTQYFRFFGKLRR